MNDVKYLFSFKTNKSTCILRVNGFPAIENSKAESGTISAGFNMTAFLENGDNDIEMLMGSLDYEDPDTLYSDSSCQITISKDTEESSVEMANFKLSVNDKGQITAGESTNFETGPFNSKVLEGYTRNEKDYGLYKLRSSLVVKGLPGWSWVNATPVTDHDLPLIRKAYTDIWNMMRNRDIEGLKKFTQISTEEMAFAEGSTTGMMFISTGFPQRVIDKKLSPIPLEWEKYELVRYRGGRLFRLATGYNQNSPLRFKDSSGKIVFAYNPYFSIIDGKVLLVR